MRKIIVAEDDRMTRQLLTGILEKEGYNVLQCENGAQALRLLEDNEDTFLMIADIIMPELDGRRLVKAVRQNPKFAESPVVIMISAVIDAKDVSNLLELGKTWFLSKPIEKVTLLKLLQGMIASLPGQAAPRP